MIPRLVIALFFISFLPEITKGQAGSTQFDSFDSAYSSSAGDSIKKFYFIKFIKESQSKKDFSSAIDMSDKAKTYFLQKKYFAGVIMISEVLGDIYYTKKDYDSSIYYFKYIIEIVDKAKPFENPISLRAKILNKTARVFERVSYDSAITYYSAAHLVYNAFKNSRSDSTSHASALSMMAYSYSRIGASQKAHEKAREAVVFADRLNDKKEIALAYNILATVMTDLNLYDDALVAFNKSLNASLETEDSIKLTGTFNGIALIYNRQNDFFKALQYYYKALGYINKNKSSFQYATVCYNIVHVLCELDSEVRAEFFIRELLENMPKIKSDEQYFGILIAICTYFIKKNNLLKAEEYMAMLTAILPLHKSKQSHVNYYLVKSKLSQARGDFKEGLEFYLIHQEFKDSISAVELADMVAEKNAIYETAKKQQEISHLRSEKEMQRLTLIQQQQQITYNKTAQEKKEAEYSLLSQKQQLSELESKQMLAKIQNEKLVTEKVNTENDLLKKGSQLQQSKLLVQKSWRNASFIFSALVIIIAFLFYNRWHINKKYSEQLEEKNKIIEAEKQKAIDNEKYKTQFLANMSHEIRTPLHAITGMINVLYEKTPREDQKAYLTVMQKSSENLMGIINNVLDISKIEAGKIEFEEMIFSPGASVQNVVNMFYVSASSKNIEFTCDTAKIPAYVKGDQMRLTQVLINLIGNAIKFTEKGRITINVSAKENVYSNNSGQLVFAIADTGIGISTEKLYTIFDTFSQEEAGINRKFGGTGLGLSISKQLIELQGGTIHATSETGKGSVFTFTLPFVFMNEDQVMLETITTNYNLREKLEGIHVLIVEDNSYNRLVAIETLKILMPDITIEIAENGVQALALLENNTFDIIFMDLQMPVMDGYTATIKIRTTLPGEKRRIPIIGVSANATATDRARCQEAGMNEYLTKPFHPSDLLAVMHKVITVKTTS